MRAWPPGSGAKTGHHREPGRCHIHGIPVPVEERPQYQELTFVPFRLANFCPAAKDSKLVKAWETGDE
jgi:hypothetical protein